MRNAAKYLQPRRVVLTTLGDSCRLRCSRNLDVEARMQEQHYQVGEEKDSYNLDFSVNSLPELTIIAPSYNERMNIRPLAAAIASAMRGHSYELIVVDDDSPDGTYMEVAALELEGAPVRCIRRVGRRGLSSAVVEGALAARSDFLAVIDADMQHDETI